MIARSSMYQDQSPSLLKLIKLPTTLSAARIGKPSTASRTHDIELLEKTRGGYAYGVVRGMISVLLFPNHSEADGPKRRRGVPERSKSCELTVADRLERQALSYVCYTQLCEQPAN